MSNKALVVTGVVLLTIGLLGVAAVALLGGMAVQPGPLYSDGQEPTPDASLGEQIYYTGRGADGEPISRTGGVGHMGSGGCVTCHGADGQGGQIGMMFNFIETPPITYDALTGMHEEHDGQAEEPWTEDDIARAIRTGVEPDGNRLDAFMPRWDMNSREMDALIEYLKTL